MSILYQGNKTRRRYSYRSLVVDRIRTPIEKAQSVKSQQEDRLNDMEETLKE